MKLTKYLKPKDDTKLDPQMLNSMIEKAKSHLDSKCLRKEDLTCFTNRNDSHSKIWRLLSSRTIFNFYK